MARTVSRQLVPQRLASTHHHQDENMKRHTSHTATAPSSHTPSKLLVPSRQPRRKEQESNGGIGTLLALAVVQIIMPGQIIILVVAISSAQSRDSVRMAWWP
jgi:hypothetical protein